MPPKGHPKTDEVLAAEQALTVARSEAEAAVSRNAALRARVQDGGDVSAADLTAAKAHADHAELRVEAAHRKLANVRMTARTAACKEIAAEIRATDTAATVQEIRDEVERAIAVLAAAEARIVAHNAMVDGWYQRLQHLDAHSDVNGWRPPAEQGDVATMPAEYGHGVRVGDLAVWALDAGRLRFLFGHGLQTAPGTSPDFTQVEAMLATMTRNMGRAPRSTAVLTAAAFREDS